MRAPTRVLALAAMAVLAANLAACAAPEEGPPPVAPVPLAPPPPRIVGNDGDPLATEGPASCKPSTGYIWCDSARRCVRPWELAREKGFPNTLEGFQAFCRPAPK